MTNRIFEPGTDELYFRLEFKESTNQWHYDNFNHPPNTHGWQTIAEREPDSKLRKFTYTIDSLKKKFTTVQILQLWDLYTTFDRPHDINKN